MEKNHLNSSTPSSKARKLQSIRAFYLAYKTLFCLFLLFHTDLSFAGSYTDATIGTIATTILQSFGDLTKFITAMSYLSGLGFTISSLMKFRQYVNNPTQNTINAPIALLLVGSAFLFFPSILGMTGQTLFGGMQQTAGPLGVVF